MIMNVTSTLDLIVGYKIRNVTFVVGATITLFTYQINNLHEPSSTNT